MSLSLILSYSTLRLGSDYQGQFGTFLFPLKCGTGNRKSSLVSKVPKRPQHYTNMLCSCQGTQALWSHMALGVIIYEKPGAYLFYSCLILN